MIYHWLSNVDSVLVCWFNDDGASDSTKIWSSWPVVQLSVRLVPAAETSQLITILEVILDFSIRRIWKSNYTPFPLWSLFTFLTSASSWGLANKRWSPDMRTTPLELGKECLMSYLGTRQFIDLTFSCGFSCQRQDWIVPGFSRTLQKLEASDQTNFRVPVNVAAGCCVKL